MNSSPIPQPSAYTCPNCGAPIDGQPQFCPRCGASLLAANPAATGCMNIAVQIFLGCLAVALGLSGACFVVIGASSGSTSEFGSGAYIFLGVGVVILAIAGLCIWGIFRLAKPK